MYFVNLNNAYATTRTPHPLLYCLYTGRTSRCGAIRPAIQAMDQAIRTVEVEFWNDGLAGLIGI
jgi:hypothetical protein